MKPCLILYFINSIYPTELRGLADHEIRWSSSLFTKVNATFSLFTVFCTEIYKIENAIAL